MDSYRRKQLLKIRQAFVDRYKAAKLFGDKYYMQWFKKQVKDIDKELNENE